MKTNKKAFTIKVSESIIDRLRHVVYWSPGLTLNGLCELALERELEKWEQVHKDKPDIPIKLRPGLKIKYKGQDFEVSSGNVFKDLGFENAEEKLKEAQERHKKEMEKK
jgi:hypothetical protein